MTRKQTVRALVLLAVVAVACGAVGVVCATHGWALSAAIWGVGAGLSLGVGAWMAVEEF